MRKIFTIFLLVSMMCVSICGCSSASARQETLLTIEEKVAIVCEHKVDDTDKPVVAAFCKVRELYYGGEHKWRPPDSPMNVRQAIDKFRKYAKQHKGG